MAKLALRMLLVSVDSVAAALRFYQEGLGLQLKFQDGDHYAALDAGPVTVALATNDEHPVPGQTAISFKTDDVTMAVEQLVSAGAEVISPITYGAHEVRAALRSPTGMALVVYAPTP